jgi:hypothetical protein
MPAEGRLDYGMNTPLTAARRPVWVRVYRLSQSQIETGHSVPSVPGQFSSWKLPL